MPMEIVERDAIVRALVEAGGNRVKAAGMLGIARSSLYRKIDAYGIRSLESSRTFVSGSPVTERSLKVFAVRASVKRRARPSSLSLVRLVSRLACTGVAAICPLQKIVKGIRFTDDPAGRVAARC
jgi:Bacterial regulatory protein, Fis family